jgi:hypothetical protein
MHDLDLESMSLELQNCLLPMTLSKEGSTISFRGQVVAYIVPQQGFTEPTEPWSDEKNTRRCELIDKKYDGGGLSVDEFLELQQLQNEVDHYVQKVAPRPINQLRKLHQQLLMQSQQPIS